MTRNSDKVGPPEHASEDSMLTGLEAKAAEKTTEIIIERLAPKITGYGKMLWSGKKFLILGPPRSGKTSFINFLEYDLFQPEKITSITFNVATGDDRVLKLGGNRSLTLRVRKPRDVPGQMPLQQIQYVEEYKPHCIVVVLDATKFWGVPASESSLQWLEEFCRHLDILLKKNKKVARKLKSMVVVMNKWDKITAKDKEDDKTNRALFESYVRDILDKSLNNEFYYKGGANVIDVMPCALVKSLLGDGPAKEVIQSIALAMRR